MIESQWVLESWHFWLVVILLVGILIHLATIADHLKKFNEKFTDRLGKKKNNGGQK